MHDSPSELAQPFEVKDWKRGECELIPGKTAPNLQVVERDYPNVYKRFTSLGPLMDKIGNGTKGIAWPTGHEVELLKQLNGVVTAEGASKGLARIESDIDAEGTVGPVKLQEDESGDDRGQGERQVDDRIEESLAAE